MPTQVTMKPKTTVTIWMGVACRPWYRMTPERSACAWAGWHALVIRTDAVNTASGQRRRSKDATR